MSDKKKAVEAIRDAMHAVTKNLDGGTYREVLEEIATDIEGHLEALREEESPDA